MGIVNGQAPTRWASGEVVLDGDAGVLIEFFGLLDEPDFHFDVVTP